MLFKDAMHAGLEFKATNTSVTSVSVKLSQTEMFIKF